MMQPCMDVTCRYADLSEIDRSKRKWQAVVMVIPPILTEDGKLHEPKRLDGCLLPLLRDLQRLGPQPPPTTPAHKFDPPSLPRNEIGEMQ
jgi:hypothetical protein